MTTALTPTRRYCAQRVRATQRRRPGAIRQAICRQNRDGNEPRCYLFNAPEDAPLETLAYLGGSRWHIETVFETGKSVMGMDEYQTRTWAGWHRHITMCLPAGAFRADPATGSGEKMSQITRPQVYRVVRELLPRRQFGPEELLQWLAEVQRRD